MPLIEIDGSYFNPSTVDAVIPLPAQKSKGMFDYKPEVEIVLKNGRVIKTALSVEEIITKCKELSVAPSHSEGNESPDYNTKDFMMLMEDMLKEFKNLNEHVHTIQEYTMRRALGNQEGIL
jgi:hypothetical protein